MSVFCFNGFIQAAQNGPSGGLGVDTALCQQGAAVSYSQKGNTFSGLDVSSFKPQTDVRVAPLPGAGAALMGTFPAGWLVASASKSEQELNKLPVIKYAFCV